MSFTRIFLAVSFAILACAVVIGALVICFAQFAEWSDRKTKAVAAMQSIERRLDEITNQSSPASMARAERNLEELNEIRETLPLSYEVVRLNLQAKPFLPLSEDEERLLRYVSGSRKTAQTPAQPAAPTPSPTPFIAHLNRAIAMANGQSIPKGSEVEIVKRDGNFLTVSHAGHRYEITAFDTDLPQ